MIAMAESAAKKRVLDLQGLFGAKGAKELKLLFKKLLKEEYLLKTALADVDEQAEKAKAHVHAMMDLGLI